MWKVYVFQEICCKIKRKYKVYTICVLCIENGIFDPNIRNSNTQLKNTQKYTPASNFYWCIEIITECDAIIMEKTSVLARRQRLWWKSKIWVKLKCRERERELERAKCLTNKKQNHQKSTMWSTRRCNMSMNSIYISSANYFTYF